MNSIDYSLYNKAGIYIIINVITNKIYIGSSKNIYNRIHQHFSNLRSNRHHNKHLQSAYNKYGKENFVFNVLCECDSEIRFIIEQEYLTKYKPDYNKSDNVIGNLNCKISDETKKKISDTLKKRYKKGMINQGYIKLRKTLYQFDLNKNYIQSFESVAIGAHKLNINKKTIMNVCGNYSNAQTAGGYRFSYDRNFFK